MGIRLRFTFVISAGGGGGDDNAPGEGGAGKAGLIFFNTSSFIKIGGLRIRLASGLLENSLQSNSHVDDILFFVPAYSLVIHAFVKNDTIPIPGGGGESLLIRQAQMWKLSPRKLPFPRTWNNIEMDFF